MTAARRDQRQAFDAHATDQIAAALREAPEPITGSELADYVGGFQYPRMQPCILGSHGRHLQADHYETVCRGTHDEMFVRWSGSSLHPYLRLLEAAGQVRRAGRGGRCNAIIWEWCGLETGDEVAAVLDELAAEHQHQ